MRTVLLGKLDESAVRLHVVAPRTAVCAVGVGQGLGFPVYGLWMRVHSLWFIPLGFGFRVPCSCPTDGSLRGWGAGFRLINYFAKL